MRKMGTHQTDFPLEVDRSTLSQDQRHFITYVDNQLLLAREGRLRGTRPRQEKGLDQSE